jgi:hypothetical protein
VRQSNFFHGVVDLVGVAEKLTVRAAGLHKGQHFVEVGALVAILGFEHLEQRLHRRRHDGVFDFDLCHRGTPKLKACF